MDPKIFSPLADAVMASLASRSHEWEAWTLEENVEVDFDPHGVALKETLELIIRVNFLNGSTQTTAKEGSSPSELVHKLLDPKLSRGKKLSFPSGDLSWPKSVPTNIESKVFQGKAWQLRLCRVKNSQGYLGATAVAHGKKRVEKLF